MTLIAQVARLRELERQMMPGEWKVENGTRNDDYIESSNNRLIAAFGRQIFSPEEQKWMLFKNAEGIADLRNAAPALLSILGAFQEGDAMVLDLFLNYILYIDSGGHLTDGSPITTKQGKDCLKRLIAAARKMEAEQEKQR